MLTLEEIPFNQYKIVYSPIDGEVNGRMYLTYSLPGPKQMGIAKPDKHYEIFIPDIDDLLTKVTIAQLGGLSCKVHLVNPITGLDFEPYFDKEVIWLIHGKLLMNYTAKNTVNTHRVEVR